MFYIYNKDKEFLCETEGQPNPLKKGKFFIPANSTTIKPLDPKDGFMVRFNVDKWEYVEDNRDKNYWLKSDASKIDFKLGNLIDNTMTNINPIDLKFPIWDDIKWIEDIKELQKQGEEKFTNTIETFIQHEVEVLNKANSVKFSNIHNCKSYAMTDGYPLQSDCKAITDWAFLTVWIKMRAWQKTLTTIPTDAEFQAELDKVKFNG